MSADTFVGVLWVIIAACAAGSFTFLDPKATKWFSAPAYVRFWLVPVSLAAVFRGANLVSLAQNPDPSAPGRANLEAMVVTFFVTGLVVSLTAWLTVSVMPDRAWHRLEWVRKMLRSDRGLTPMVVSADEIVGVAQAAGMYAIRPGEGAEAAIREGKRLPAVPVD